MQASKSRCTSATYGKALSRDPTQSARITLSQGVQLPQLRIITLRTSEPRKYFSKCIVQREESDKLDGNETCVSGAPIRTFTLEPNDSRRYLLRWVSISFHIKTDRNDVSFLSQIILCFSIFELPGESFLMRREEKMCVCTHTYSYKYRFPFYLIVASRFSR